jgi:hypothetical protein
MAEADDDEGGVLVFAWGSGESLGREDKADVMPEQPVDALAGLESHDELLTLAAGGSHTVFVFEGNTVLSFGHNGDGQ